MHCLKPVWTELEQFGVVQGQKNDGDAMLRGKAVVVCMRLFDCHSQPIVVDVHLSASLVLHCCFLNASSLPVNGLFDLAPIDDCCSCLVARQAAVGGVTLDMSQTTEVQVALSHERRYLSRDSIVSPSKVDNPIVCRLRQALTGYVIVRILFGLVWSNPEPIRQGRTRIWPRRLLVILGLGV